MDERLYLNLEKQILDRVTISKEECKLFVDLMAFMIKKIIIEKNGYTFENFGRFHVKSYRNVRRRFWYKQIVFNAAFIFRSRKEHAFSTNGEIEKVLKTCFGIDQLRAKNLHRIFFQCITVAIREYDGAFIPNFGTFKIKGKSANGHDMIRFKACKIFEMEARKRHANIILPKRIKSILKFLNFSEKSVLRSDRNIYN
jgi:nucleoid DNA-binding protein